MTRLLCYVSFLAVMLSTTTALAGVSGTHGPDRASGAVVAKPKPAPTVEQTSEQTAKPEEKKENEPAKDAK